MAFRPNSKLIPSQSHSTQWIDYNITIKKNPQLKLPTQNKKIHASSFLPKLGPTNPLADAQPTELCCHPFVRFSFKLLKRKNLSV